MSKASKYAQSRETLLKIDNIFKQNNVLYWLEAGTALAAVRDGKIFDWEHDIDVAVWREDEGKVLKALDQFILEGYKVKVQKGMPLLDNIIQVECPLDENGDKPFPDQVDIYLYSKKDDYVFMRWLQKPTGIFSLTRKRIFEWAVLLATGRSRRFRGIIELFPIWLRTFIFKIILRIHVHTSSCIYHRFPKSFFENLREIDFYGIKMKIAANTDEYLSYRYGSNWKTPDSQFNQDGKWKKAQARVEMSMSHLPVPRVDMSLVEKY